jgi:predicted component of type VI protein secretion system
MAKLVVSRAGASLGSWFIEGERLTIGRAESAGVRLEDTAVSKQHAAIDLIGHDHMLLDLGSSNGTFVNGTRVTRHLLKHGDIVEIVDFQLRYVDHKSIVAEAERTSIFRTADVLLVHPTGAAPAAEARAIDLKLPQGVLRSVGKTAVREIALDLALTGVGSRHDDYAAVFRRPQGFFVATVSGKPPRHNGRAIGEGWQPLKHGDEIQVGTDRFELVVTAPGR